jgi:hypothetical protein
VTGPKIIEKAMFLYYEMKITDLPVKNSDQYWNCTTIQNI